MKIRTKNELLDTIQNERSWRRKEITNIKSLIQNSRNKDNTVLLRSGFLILYSHWEGFIKKSSEAFFYYLNNKGIKYCDLKQNLIALGVSEEFNWNFPEKKFDSYTKAVCFLTTDIHEKKFKIDVKSRIDTKSNLNSSVMKDLANMIGIEYTLFENHKHYIDNKLLKYRNAIAHGERTDNNPEYDISQEEFELTSQKINILMDHFETLIFNHVETESFIN